MKIDMENEISYVKKEAVELVKKYFIKEQEKNPFCHVTKKQLYKQLKSDSKNVSYRTMERAIIRLKNLDIIKQVERGKYWLMETWKKEVNNQNKIIIELEQEKEKIKQELDNQNKIITGFEQEKEKIKQEKFGKELQLRIAKPYAELMKYCESDKDWLIWEAFVKKMLENKQRKLWEESKKAEQEQMKEQFELIAKSRNPEADKELAKKAYQAYESKLKKQTKQ
jgi:hypothetical protein